jgi:hypothetical protein
LISPAIPNILKSGLGNYKAVSIFAILFEGVSPKRALKTAK